MGVVGVALRGFGKALTHGKNWSKARKISKKGKLHPKTTPDKSKLDLSTSELRIVTAKAKGATKMAKDVQANPHLFKEGKAFKEGLGKFGFNKPSGKK